MPAKKYKNYVLFVEEWRFKKENCPSFYVEIFFKPTMTLVDSTAAWSDEKQAIENAKEIIDSWEKKS